MGFIGWIVAAVLAYASYRISQKYKRVCHELEAAGMRTRDLENKLNIAVTSYRLLNSNLRKVANDVEKQIDEVISKPSTVKSDVFLDIAERVRKEGDL